MQGLQVLTWRPSNDPKGALGPRVMSTTTYLHSITRYPYCSVGIIKLDIH